MKPSKYAMPEADYNALDALRSSDLGPALLSWEHFRTARDMPREDTEAFALGRLAHAMIRGGEEAARFEFVTAEGLGPPINKSTKEPYKRGSQTYDAWLADVDTGGRTIVTGDEWRESRAQAAAVRRNRTAMAAIDGAEHEVSFVGFIDGVLCKARVDYWREEDGAWSDVKTMRHPATRFPRVAADLNYLLKAAFQSLVIESALCARPDKNRWIALEKSAPYGVKVFPMDAVTLLPWCDKVRELVRGYAKCEQAGAWPGYEDREEEWEIPTWAFPKLDPSQIKEMEVIL